MTSKVALAAFNTVTNAFYIRDTGYLLNSFLPSSVTTLSGDGAVTGDKTPAAGLTIDKTTAASFADSSFSTWLSAQTATDVRWFLSAVDSVGTNAASNVKRFITSSANASETATNGNLDGYISSANAGGLGACARITRIYHPRCAADGRWESPRKLLSSSS